MNHIIAIVGVGGSGGWLVQLFAKSEFKDTVFHLIDGDLVEEKNINRQLVSANSIGEPKVEALAVCLENMKRPVEKHPEYISGTSKAYKELSAHEGLLTIMCCVDNHPARMTCLDLVDERFAAGKETFLFLAGNEYETASAQVYRGVWKDEPLDPRVMFPEIMTDTEGDPLAPECAGAALESSPQLALSNAISAMSAAWLHRFWTEVRAGFKSLSEEDYATLVPTFPVLVDWTNGRQVTKTVKHFMEV